jgi:hypothetical protein
VEIIYHERHIGSVGGTEVLAGEEAGIAADHLLIAAVAQ